MYTVKCKNCGKDYESKANRSGLCSDCKVSARSKNNTKYRDANYEQIMFYVKKGDKALIKEFANTYGMSLNELCNKALDSFMAKCYEEDPREPEENDNYNRNDIKQKSI